MLLSELEKQLAEYQAQAEQLTSGLQQLEMDYVKKKEQGMATLNQLIGAIQALQILKASFPATLSVEAALAEAANDVPVA